MQRRRLEGPKYLTTGDETWIYAFLDKETTETIGSFALSLWWNANQILWTSNCEQKDVCIFFGMNEHFLT